MTKKNTKPLTKKHPLNIPLPDNYDENENPTRMLITDVTHRDLDEEDKKSGIIDSWRIGTDYFINKKKEKLTYQYHSNYRIMIFDNHIMQLYTAEYNSKNLKIVRTSKQLMSEVTFDLSQYTLYDGSLFSDINLFIQTIQKHKGNIIKPVLIYHPDMDIGALTYYKKQIGFQGDIEKFKEIFKTGQNIFDNLTIKLKKEEKELSKFDRLVKEGKYIQSNVNEYVKDGQFENILLPYIQNYEQQKEVKTVEINNIKSQINDYHENNQAKIFRCGDGSILKLIFQFLLPKTIDIWTVMNRHHYYYDNELYIYNQDKEIFDLYKTLKDINTIFRFLLYKTVHIHLNIGHLYGIDIKDITTISYSEIPIKEFVYNENININDVLKKIKNPYIHRLTIITDRYNSYNNPKILSEYCNKIREIKLDINMIGEYQNLIKRLNSKHIIFMKYIRGIITRESEFVNISNVINDFKTSITYYYENDDVLMYILKKVKISRYYLEYKENDKLSLYNLFQSITIDDRQKNVIEIEYTPTSPSYSPTSPSYTATSIHQEKLEEERKIQREKLEEESKPKPLPLEYYWIYRLKPLKELSNMLKKEREEITEKKEKKKLTSEKKRKINEKNGSKKKNKN